MLRLQCPSALSMRSATVKVGFEEGDHVGAISGTGQPGKLHRVARKEVLRAAQPPVERSGVPGGARVRERARIASESEHGAGFSWSDCSEARTRLVHARLRRVAGHADKEQLRPPRGVAVGEYRGACGERERRCGGRVPAPQEVPCDQTGVVRRDARGVREARR